MTLNPEQIYYILPEQDDSLSLIYKVRGFEPSTGDVVYEIDNDRYRIARYHVFPTYDAAVQELKERRASWIQFYVQKMGAILADIQRITESTPFLTDRTIPSSSL